MNFAERNVLTRFTTRVSGVTDWRAGVPAVPLAG